MHAAPRPRHIVRDAAILLIACAAVFWLRLGETGLSMTEGHRVIPGWEMLDTGNWWSPTMFGQVYLRKPPGMSWAVAASASILGKTEFSARAVSAAASTLSAFLIMFFAGRWFGRRYALWGGLAFALTPLFWSPGRSAEIEALNNLGALAGMLLTIDLLIFPGPRRANLLRAAALAGAMLVAALAKGPAAAPCLVAAVLGPCAATRSLSPLRAWSWWFIAAAIGFAVAALLASKISNEVLALGQTPISQSASEFLWAAGKWTPGAIAPILLVPLIAWASALPTSLALLFPWGHEAVAEGQRDPGAFLAARAAAWTIVLALAVYPVLGVDNPRYAMPPMTLAPVLVAYFVRGAAEWFEGKRLATARVVLLGTPILWPIALGAAALAYATVIEPSARQSSGRQAGRALAEHLPDGAQVWANDLVEARPETLLYAVRRAAKQGKTVTIHWVPELTRGAVPPSGAYVVLRTDANATDLPFIRTYVLMPMLTPRAQGRVHKYDFTLFEVDWGPR